MKKKKEAKVIEKEKEMDTRKQQHTKTRALLLEVRCRILAKGTVVLLVLGYMASINQTLPLHLLCFPHSKSPVLSISGSTHNATTFSFVSVDSPSRLCYFPVGELLQCSRDSCLSEGEEV